MSTGVFLSLMLFTGVNLGAVVTFGGIGSSGIVFLYLIRKKPSSLVGGENAFPSKSNALKQSKNYFYNMLILSSDKCQYNFKKI